MLDSTTSIRRRSWALLLSALLLSACDMTPPPEIPSELLGRWVTDTEGYEGREISLVGDRLLISLGGPVGRAHPIDRIQSSPYGIQTEYRLFFRNEEGLNDELILRYENREGDETLRIRNLEMVIWRRVGASRPSELPESIG
ncbi:MAG: hypothetical protein R3E10_16500 [Gemmatimonadota bacterium]